MKHNIGKTDRVIRTTAAACIAYAIIVGAVGGPLALILGLLAVMLGATAVFGYCPPYSWLGIKTCKCEEHDEEKKSAAS
jgi:hypothetical protein